MKPSSLCSSPFEAIRYSAGKIGETGTSTAMKPSTYNPCSLKDVLGKW